MKLRSSDLKVGKTFRMVVYIKGKKHLAKLQVLTIQSWKKISKQDQKYTHTASD